MIKYFTVFLLPLFIFSCGYPDIDNVPDFKDIKLTDEEWAEYLFMRNNPKGNFTERWFHAHGCRKWFNVVRNTVTNEISEIYPAGSLPKSPEGKSAYKSNWRRNSQAEIKSLK